MLHLSMLAQRMTSLSAKINFLENVENNEHVEIISDYDFNVSYAEDKKHCKANLDLNVFCPKYPDLFEIKVSVEGVFQTDELKSEELKKEAHVLSYYLLFPYAQSLVSQMTVAASMPPLTIPADEMKVEQVVIGEQ